MDEKKKKLELIKAEMQKIAKMPRETRELMIARTIGDVYDVELPIAPVIESIARTERADVGEHVYFLAPDTITKTVNTLTSDCNVTQTKITPNTRTEVSWTDLISPEFYVCLHDWLKGDHDVLKFYADSISEAMDRQEIYSVLQLVDTGATNESNTYNLDSGVETFDYPKLVEMARSLAKYGNRLVLITGANVTTDIQLINYNADKNQAVDIMDIVDEHIKVEELSVTIDGTPTTVIGADTAYLVATSDAKQNRPLLFARRRTQDLTDAMDTEAMGKERIVIDGGNLINVGSNRKFSRSKTGFQEYSGTSLNDKTYAKFTRS